MLIKDENALLSIANKLAKITVYPLVIYLQGDLGVGKTTFSRGFLHGLGYHGAVKSPTYTLVETYSFGHYEVVHFDLYRIHDPNELESIGIRDYFKKNTVALIEWPDLGRGRLPAPDIICKLAMSNDADARLLEFETQTQIGKEIIERFA